MSKADKEITYNELKGLLGTSSNLLLIDVRTKEEVQRGKIPGSINIPLDTVESDLVLDPAAFQAKFGVPKPPLDSPELVFHCQTGRRAGMAMEKARSLGFQRCWGCEHC
ncbi:thiosulfate:glutathione sulfurtransferase-like isoform X2 [Megalops cyprinoides]|uniref:thiosulfate:glutathione sulfurtransferase-like isoform X2 n=1 Tax=Megalops cyprinoides TaxID=118141 RepID=UPI001863D0A1|nr:thiosulfate:glutathione sulfurtransferase-like isoform X2 [Megalops cyprinoides]